MKKQTILWTILVLLIVGSLPGIISRWHVEENNNTYELAVPFHEIYGLTEDQDISFDEALAYLKEAGLHSISLEPFSLQALENLKILTIFDQQTFENMALLVDGNFKMDHQAKGFYVTKPKDNYYISLIEDNFDTKEHSINGQDFYFIKTKKDGPGRRTPFSYDQEIIKQIKKYDFNLILRAENNSPEINKRILDNFAQLKNDSMISGVLFTGEEVINFPSSQDITHTGKLLNDLNYHTYSIEFSDQKGMQTLARSMDYNVIRLHSIDLENGTVEENVDRVIRAVKERNIRTIFFHLSKDEPEESLETATNFISKVIHQMPEKFTSGQPTSFDDIQQPKWNLLLFLLAGIIFIYIASEILNNRWLSYAAVIFMILLVGGYFGLQKLIFLQAFGLIIAIITPIYAVLRTSLLKKKEQSIWLSYLIAVGISMIGILIIIGVLNGNGFITGFELFRGVKLVYAVPLLFITAFIMFGNYSISENKRRVIDFLTMPIKYWHALLLMVLGAVLVYYMMRTGNAGTVSSLELTIRQMLEEVLYVRPRTKEFLIGFPLFLLALYGLQKGDIWGKILLIPGSIGFLSIINTFSHLHIPLSVSVLRTIYSVILGFVLGLLLIYIYNILSRTLMTIRKKR